MKLITIYQENCEKIFIEDSDDSNIQEYSKNISKLLESNNVAILHTSENQSIVLRPNKICSILVEERIEKEIDKVTDNKLEQIDIVKD